MALFFIISVMAQIEFAKERINNYKNENQNELFGTSV